MKPPGGLRFPPLWERSAEEPNHTIPSCSRTPEEGGKTATCAPRALWTKKPPGKPQPAKSRPRQANRSKLTKQNSPNRFRTVRAFRKRRRSRSYQAACCEASKKRRTLPSLDTSEHRHWTRWAALGPLSARRIEPWSFNALNVSPQRVEPTPLYALSKDHSTR